MKLIPSTADSQFPKSSPPSEVDETDSVATHSSGFLMWLKHLVLYLGAVVVAGITGLYFLWHIPVVQDPAQLFKSASDTATPKTLTTVVTPPASPVSPPRAPSQPSGNATTTLADSSPIPDDGTTVPPSSATEAVGDPNAITPPAVEQPATAEQPATVAEDQANPPIETTPLTPQAEIEQLLTSAQQQMSSRRFTAPASGNALNTYRRVLELQPNHPAALEGIQHITTYYRDVAQRSLQQGRLDESLAYINRGLRAEPKSDALLSLRRDVQRAKQREQEERQTLLENLQRQQEEQARLARFRRESERQQQQQQQQQQPWWQRPAQSQESGFNQR